MPEALFPSFSGGINTSLPAEQIRDDELADAVNFHLDPLRQLVTRPGMQQGYGTTPGTGGTPAWDAGDPGQPFEFFPSTAANPHVIIPKGNNLYSFPQPNWDSYVDITNSLALPTGARWQWAQMDDFAIGVNGATAASGDANPVVCPEPVGTGATALAAAPEGTYIEYFGRRIFIVPTADLTQIKYCAVGDHTDWTTEGSTGAGTIEVGGDEYGPITGIKAWQGRLFIFKLNAIYQLVPGSPNVDNRQWQVIEYARNVGCVSAWTIQQVGDDIVFLGAQGVTSLRATQGGVGEFQQDSLSRNVPALSRVPKGNPEQFTSLVWPQEFQYWLGVPDASETGPKQLWVLDFRGMLVGQGPAWMLYDGDLAEAKGGFCVVRSAQSKETIAVSSSFPYVVDATASVYQDDPDGSTASMSNPTARTKAFSFGRPLSRKECYLFAIEFGVKTDSAAMIVQYRFDENSEREKTILFTYGDTQQGSLLDGADVLDTSFQLLTVATASTDFARSFRGRAGRRGKTLQFRVSSSDASKGFSVRRIRVMFSYLLQGLFGVDNTDD